MKYSDLRNWLIGVIFFGYLLLVLALITLWLIGGFKFDEFTTTVSIVVPLLATHVATAVAYFQRTTKIENENREATRLQASIALTPPVLLIVIVLILALVKGFRLSPITFEEFKTSLAAIYGMFGAYVATIVTYYLRDSSERVSVAPSASPVEAPPTATGK